MFPSRKPEHVGVPAQVRRDAGGGGAGGTVVTPDGVGEYEQDSPGGSPGSARDGGVDGPIDAGARRSLGEAGAVRPVRVLWASGLAGVVGGLVGACYLAVLALLKRLLWPSGHSGHLEQAGLLVLVGVLVGVLLALLGDPGETGQLIDSVHLVGGPSTLRPLVALVPVSLVGIGGGGGIGPEPPLMQTTGTLASWIGRRLALRPAELRVLTVTGMASGLTVLFAAPLGAAVFALEILHRKGLEYYEALLPSCVGSLSSFGVYILVTGHGTRPAWHFLPAPRHIDPLSLLAGAGCGMAGALVAVVFAGMIGMSRRALRPVPGWARPPVAGAVLGAVGLLSPYALTFGEGQIAELSGRPGVAVPVLLLTAFAHLVSAALSLAGRWKGGIIIPMFLVGYCLGRAAAVVGGHPGATVLLATATMVACNVGMTKTPLGSTLVVSQMTDLRVLPPLLVAALVSLCLTRGVGFIGGQRPRH